MSYFRAKVLPDEDKGFQAGNTRAQARTAIHANRWLYGPRLSTFFLLGDPGFGGNFVNLLGTLPRLSLSLSPYIP